MGRCIPFFWVYRFFYAFAILGLLWQSTVNGCPTGSKGDFDDVGKAINNSKTTTFLGLPKSALESKKLLPEVLKEHLIGNIFSSPKWKQLSGRGLTNPEKVLFASELIETVNKATALATKRLTNGHIDSKVTQTILDRLKAQLNYLNQVKSLPESELSKINPNDFEKLIGDTAELLAIDKLGRFGVPSGPISMSGLKFGDFQKVAESTGFGDTLWEISRRSIAGDLSSVYPSLKSAYANPNFKAGEIDVLFGQKANGLPEFIGEVKTTLSGRPLDSSSEHIKKMLNPDESQLTKLTAVVDAITPIGDRPNLAFVAATGIDDAAAEALLRGIAKPGSEGRLMQRFDVVVDGATDELLSLQNGRLTRTKLKDALSKPQAQNSSGPPPPPNQGSN